MIINRIHEHQNLLSL